MGLMDKLEGKRQILEILADRPAWKKELRNQLQVEDRQLGRWLTELVDEGKTERLKAGYYGITDKGLDYIATVTATPYVIDQFKPIYDILLELCPPYAAVFQLMNQAIAFKQSELFYIPSYDEHHPSFILTGKTGDGKSPLFKLVARIWGQVPSLCRKEIRTATFGELVGRHDSQGGFKPCDYWQRPLFLMEEFDKAKDEQKRAALLYLQGTRTVLIENKAIEHKTVPVLESNIPPNRGLFDLFSDPTLRRAVVLDTHSLNLDPERVERAFQKLLDQMRLPVIDPEDLVVEKRSLTEQEIELLRNLLKENLEATWVINTRTASYLVLGGCLLGMPVELSIYSTVFCLLSCHATIPGWVRPGWRIRLKEYFDEYKESERVTIVEEGEEEIIDITPSVVGASEGEQLEEVKDEAEEVVERTMKQMDFDRRKEQLISGGKFLKGMYDEVVDEAPRRYRRRVTEMASPEKVALDCWIKKCGQIKEFDWVGLEYYEELFPQLQEYHEGKQERVRSTIKGLVDAHIQRKEESSIRARQTLLKLGERYSEILSKLPRLSEPPALPPSEEAQEVQPPSQPETELPTVPVAREVREAQPPPKPRPIQEVQVPTFREIMRDMGRDIWRWIKGEDRVQSSEEKEQPEEEEEGYIDAPPYSLSEQEQKRTSPPSGEEPIAL